MVSVAGEAAVPGRQTARRDDVGAAGRHELAHDQGASGVHPIRLAIDLAASGVQQHGHAGRRDAHATEVGDSMRVRVVDEPTRRVGDRLGTAEPAGGDAMAPCQKPGRRR